MEKLIHFLRGYVRIRVWGYSPERFMNMCSNHDILLWDIQDHGTYYSMYISIAGFFHLKSISQKTKTRVAIEQKNGLPFLIPHMKKRSIFIMGLIGCLIFLEWMSGFIWTIEITGNKSLTTDVLTDFLEEKGIVCGSLKRALDIETLEKALRKQYDNITWTSARLEGTKLCIQIKENDRKPPVIETPVTDGMDLQADKAGKIVGMITRSGVPMVRIDDEVSQGDVLVSGAVPIYGEDAVVRDYLMCRADADIYLECSYQYRERLPAEYQCKHYTGNTQKIPYLRLMGWEIHFPVKRADFAKSDCIVSETRIEPLKDFYLPVSFGSFCYREYVLTEQKYTEKQAKKLCQEKLERIMQTLEEKGVQILQKNVKIKRDSRQYELQADFTVVEKTGVLIEAQTKPLPASDGTEVIKEQ